MKKKRFIGSLLILCLLLSLTVTGCKKKDNNGGSNGNSNQSSNNSSSKNDKNKTAEKTKVTNVYKTEYHPIDLENENCYVDSFISDGKDIYAIVEYYDEETWKLKNFIYKYTDGRMKQHVQLPDPDENSSLRTSGSFIKDGYLYAILYSYTWDPVTYESSNDMSLMKYDINTGELADCIPLNKLLFRNDTEYHYINTFVNIDDKVCLYDGSTQKGYIYSLTDNAVVGGFSCENVIPDADYTYIESMWAGKNNRLMFAVYASMEIGGVWQEKSCIVSFDVTTNSMEVIDSSTLPNELLDNMYGIVAGPNHDVYFSTIDGVFAFDFGSTEVIPLMNFLNSDISGETSRRFMIIDDEHFFNGTYDDTSKDYKMILAEHTKVPDDQVAAKYTVVIGGEYISYDLRRAILKYNRSSDDYRITIKNYETYNTRDDYTLAASQLNNDILGGTAPDIILLNSLDSYTNYAQKGLFTDLYPFIDKDSEINRSDLNTNVLGAFEYRNKLYLAFPSFCISTLVGKKSNIGDRNGWTVAEFLEYAKSLPEDKYVLYGYSREDLLDLFLSETLDSYIDFDKGTCDFKNEEFKALLNFLKTVPEKSPMSEVWDSDEYDEEFWNFYENMYRNDTTMLTNIYVSGYSSLMDEIKYQFRINSYSDITCVGFPNSSRSLGTITSAEYGYAAINSKSNVQDGAWDFIRIFFKDDFYDIEASNRYGIYGFPVNNKACAKLAEKAKEIPFYDYSYGWDDVIIGGGIIRTYDATAVAPTPTVTPSDSTETSAEDIDESAEIGEYFPSKEILDGDTSEGDIGFDDGEWDEPYPEYPEWEEPEPFYLTDDDIAMINNLIAKSTKASRSWEDIMKIIIDESAYFFNGQKDVDETVKIIQNKLQILISESL